MQRAAAPLRGVRGWLVSVSPRRTNLALFVLVVVAASSGVAMFAVGSGWNRWPTLIHGAAGAGVLVLSPWKSVISRRGAVRRGLAAAAPAVVLMALVVITLATGVAHRAGARELGPVLVQQLHVGAALLATPLFVWHVAARPVPVAPVDVGRRALLQGGVLVGVSSVATVVLPHRGGSPTRSLERGSFRPDDMPVTQWFTDQVPTIDARSWRLVVAGRSWSLADLDALVEEQGGELVATLDCTGGWYARQRWRGVPLDVVLASSGATMSAPTVEVRSVTGYARSVPMADASGVLVATGVGQRPLSPGHGGPARLVVPGRRGLWWVKWLGSIDVSERPWWWQPPFPLQ